MGRLHSPRLVVHMSPGKAGQAVQIKPPFNTFVFDHDMDGLYHCIQERMAVFFSLGKRVTLGRTYGQLSQNQSEISWYYQIYLPTGLHYNCNYYSFKIFRRSDWFESLSL